MGFGLGLYRGYYGDYYYGVYGFWASKCRSRWKINWRLLQALGLSP